MDNEIIVIKFADSKVPQFKELKNKDWVYYGEDNLYPDYLLYLYNKSSKHNAIINSKTNYILGTEFEGSNPSVIKWLQSANRTGETYEVVMKKCVKDLEIFGGYYLQVNWGLDGMIKEVYHTSYPKWRIGKDDMLYWKKNWKDYREQPKVFSPFNIKERKGTQILFVKEYRPDLDVYPLPGYIGANNYIECDIEISKFHLSAIKNGFNPSKMITFNTGEPTDEKKREIEKRFGDKFQGSENAGKYLFVFNTDPAKAPIIQDLSGNDLDKQYDILNKTIQQEVFAGHQVTSAMLFGVAEPGKLGGRNELMDSYGIFLNTYAKPKQFEIEEVMNLLLKESGVDGFVVIKEHDPFGVQLTDSIITMLPKEWLYDQLNIDERYRTPQPQQMSAEYDEFQIAEMFADYGEDKEAFEILTSKKTKFNFNEDLNFLEGVKATDRKVLELIQGDKRITHEAIAEALDVSVQWVVNKIGALEKKGIIRTADGERILTKPISDIAPKESTKLQVKYSYEWGDYVPVGDRTSKTSRPFCKRLMTLNRLYSRFEIEQISSIVGYSVFDRRGGFWTRKGTDDTTPYCRHQWTMHVVKKKI